MPASNLISATRTRPGHGSRAFCDRYLFRYADLHLIIILARDRDADGDTGYILYERGEEKEYVHVHADGSCEYNWSACAPDDPRLLALIAQVAPVEVRPAARAPHPLLAPHSPRLSYLCYRSGTGIWQVYKSTPRPIQCPHQPTPE